MFVRLAPRRKSRGLQGKWLLLVRAAPHRPRLFGILYPCKKRGNAPPRVILLCLELQELIRQTKGQKREQQFPVLSALGPRFQERKPFFHQAGRFLGALHVGPGPEGDVKTKNGKVDVGITHK